MTELERQGKKSLYQCQCGNQTTAFRNNVQSGRTKSCGCLRKETCKKTGEMRTNAKLKEFEIPKIRTLLSEGYSFWKVGVVFGVSKSCIQKISDGKNWKAI